MKKHLIIIALLLVMAAFAGCVQRIDLSLPESPRAFDTGTYVNPDDPDDTYATIRLDGRVYAVCGTAASRMTGKDVGKCLGYIVQDGEERMDDRVFPLSADPERNYLVVITVNGFMDQPIFYRALDTAGKDIETPAFVQSLDYGIWN